jgi:hypothetical protein
MSMKELGSELFREATYHDKRPTFAFFEWLHTETLAEQHLHVCIDGELLTDDYM